MDSVEQQQQALKAQFLHINGDLDNAIILYSQLLLSTQSYELMINKIAALTELNNLESAQQLCEEAISLNSERYEGYMKRGIMRFNQGCLQQSSEDFKLALQKLGDNKNMSTVIKRWLNKCGAELLNKNFKPNTQNLTNQTAKVANVQKPQQEQSTKIEAGLKPIANDIISNSGKVAYTWYQTSKKIGIEINHALNNKKDLKTTFEDQKIEVSFPIGEGKDYDLNIDLYEKINKENVEVKIFLNKIEIIMEKQQSEISWKTLNSVETPLPIIGETKLQDEANLENKQQQKVVVQNQKEAGPKKLTVNEQNVPSYPSSSLKKKNWDKVDLEIEEDMKKNKDEYGHDPMNTIFKQIYENADENTRKAMIKSYQTSGGTVLSTNWDEVRSKDYEGKDKPDAPKGQEWRKWEK